MIRPHSASATLLLAVALSAGTSAQETPAKRPTHPAPGADKAAPRTIVTHGTTPTVLPGTSERAFVTIQGNALSATNAALPNAVVRLRDARLGGIVDTQTTDASGLFTFKAVDPGSYVIELMGNDQTVLAASDVLNVEAGQAVSAVVRLPFRLPPLAGILGHSAPEAATIMSAAAAAGVLATGVTNDAASPQ